MGKPQLTKHNLIRLVPHGGGPSFTVIGRCKMTVETKRNISYKTAADLQLIQIVNKVTEKASAQPNMFNGIGELKNVTVKLHVDELIKLLALK